jgi:signal transduction histidine kinase
MTVERSKILPAAGLVIWGIVSAAEIARLVERPTPTPTIVALGVALAVFAIAFVAVVGVERLGASGRAAAVAAQIVAALAVVALGRGGFAPALLVVIAGLAPMVLSTQVAIACVAMQTIGLVAIAGARWGASDSVLISGTYLGFQLFALGTGHLARRESAARLELSHAHSELVATHAMFAHSMRISERLRISRELHDALGHHLAALSLQLEVARNVADGRAIEPVEAAHAIAKQLLAELREVVGAMRADEPLDLARALRLLVAGVPRPTVHLTIPESLEVCDAVLAHILFRCVQEALTNAIRHAHAENVWIQLADDDGRLAIVARDDGCGVETMKLGNGLSGVRERVEEIGGRIEIDSSLGRGLTLRAFLPVRSAQ